MVTDKPVNRKKEYGQSPKNSNNLFKKTVRSGTIFKNFWYSRKHHALYPAFALDIVKTMSTCEPEFDNQEEKKGYSYVNRYPFNRIPNDCD